MGRAHHWFVRVASISILNIAAACVVLSAESEAHPDEQLSALIAAVRAETDPEKQMLVAREMPYFVRGADTREIDARTLGELASLLDTSGDMALPWLIFALGLFEGRSGFALPQLYALHQETHCASLQGDRLELAGAIRFAILRISGMQPPLAVCVLKLRESGDRAD